MAGHIERLENKDVYYISLTAIMLRRLLWWPRKWAHRPSRSGHFETLGRESFFIPFTCNTTFASAKYDRVDEDCSANMKLWARQGAMSGNNRQHSTFDIAENPTPSTYEHEHRYTKWQMRDMGGATQSR